MKKIVKLLVGLMIFAVIYIGLDSDKIHASMKDEATEYVLGQVYEGNTYGKWTHTMYYYFNIDTESCIYLVGTSDNISGLNLYDSAGTQIINSNDYLKGTDKISERKVWHTSRILPEGKYYVAFSTSEGDWSFVATAQEAIHLKKIKIKSLKKSGTTVSITVNTMSDDAESIEIQYDTDSKFSNPKTIFADGTSFDITKLEKGKKYYFRVRQKAIYGSGAEVYSAWSAVKSKKIG